MAAPRLVSYVEKQLKAGYDANTIRDYLIRNGYDRREVEEAIDYIYRKPKKKIPIKLIAGILIGIIVISSILLLMTREEGEIPEIEVPEVIEEEIVEEVVEEVIEEVIEEEVLECPSTCGDFDVCTEDVCGPETNYECVHFPIRPCCGNEICESRESYRNCPSDCVEDVVFLPPPKEPTISDVINKAKELAESNPSQAASYCSEQDKENYRDSCYGAVSKVSEDSVYCDLIISKIKKDSCYTTAALNGDYTVCDKIADKYLKLACNNLAETS